MMSRVLLTYGRFDPFDQTQIEVLRRLSRMGRELVVGCTSDALARAQGRPCSLPFETRRALLESCRYVSRVIAQTDADQHRTDIVNYNVSTLVVDRRASGEFDHLNDVAQVLCLADQIDPVFAHPKGSFQKIASAR